MWIGAPELRVSVSVSDSLTGRRLYLPLVRVSIQTPPRARDNFVSKNLIMTVVDTKAAPRFEQRAVLWFIWSLVFVDRLKKRKEDTKKRVFFACGGGWEEWIDERHTHRHTWDGLYEGQEYLHRVVAFFSVEELVVWWRQRLVCFVGFFFSQNKSINDCALPEKLVKISPSISQKAISLLHAASSCFLCWMVSRAVFAVVGD